MIRSFSDRTQFIVVTHNKRTMEASDYLYGVTMEEPGISTLVSVDFERRHRFDYDAIAYRGNGGALREPTGGESPPAEGPEAWGEAESRQAHVGD
jgi:hypothetical protein